MGAKYNIGDVVDFKGRKATVKDVRDSYYFLGDETPYYEYMLDIEGQFHYDWVTEAALDGPQSANSVDKKFRLCECGAWSVPWMDKHHSFWCPAYRTFERSE